MKYLKEFSNWNPNLNREVDEFIEMNKAFLFTNLWNREKSDDENLEELKNFFTEYPELMQGQIDLDRIQTVKSQTGIKNAAPILQNIGGVKDFRSF